MKLKLGDLVVRKDVSTDMLFQIIEFKKESVVIRGLKIPVITIVNREDLIKINKERKNFNSLLHIVN